MRNCSQLFWFDDNSIGLRIHAFDPTPASIEWVRSQRLPSGFIFHDYGISNFDGYVKFHAPINLEHISHSVVKHSMSSQEGFDVPINKLSTIMEDLGHDHVDILKMDIEGTEYSVIRDFREAGYLPRQVLVKFHHRVPEIGIDATKPSISELREMGYTLFSVSPTGKEYRFILR